MVQLEEKPEENLSSRDVSKPSLVSVPSTILLYQITTFIQAQTLLLRTQQKRSITMTSKVNNSFSIKSLSQATRNNRFSKLTSAVGQPLRKLFKTSSDCSTKSVSTAATEQEEFRVSFSEKIHVRNTLSCKDCTTEEIQACWYTAEENQRIHRHCSKEIRKMDEGSELKDKKYSSRGLEGHTTIGAATKKEKRWLAINAVLDEQMIQWEEGIFDEDAIAEIYCRASSSCQVKANIVGLRDHRETEVYVASC